MHAASSVRDHPNKAGTKNIKIMRFARAIHYPFNMFMKLPMSELREATRKQTIKGVKCSQTNKLPSAKSVGKESIYIIN